MYEYETLIIEEKNYNLNSLCEAIQSAFQNTFDIQITPNGNDASGWLKDGYISWTSDKRILLKVNFGNVYNPMSYVIGLYEVMNDFSDDYIANDVPDLSGIDQIFLHSNIITGTDKCLCGDFTSTSTFAVLPVTSSFGIYSFWTSPFKDLFTKIDISIHDIAGNLLTNKSDISLVFEII